MYLLLNGHNEYWTEIKSSDVSLITMDIGLDRIIRCTRTITTDIGHLMIRKQQSTQLKDIGRLN